MSTDTTAEERRIRALESELRRFRLGVTVGFLLGAGLAVTGFREAPPEVVRAERIELVDGQGVRRAILSADTAGFAVVLVDRRDGPSGAMRLSSEPRLVVETGGGREVVGLGAPKVHRLTE
jgi:hypothetical protein